MNGLPYYKRFPRDLFEGTVGMPLELKGVYGLILDLIYMQNGQLPDDARYISGLLGCSVRHWNSAREKLIAAGKIEVRNGYLGNYRADKELVSSHSFQDKQRQNAAKPRKNNGLARAMAEPKPSQSESEPDKKEERDKSLSLGDAFDAFWEAVPRRIGKEAARKAYAKALRQADAETILSGMRSYAESRRGQDDQYTAHPATWLNAGRWADEITTRPNGGFNGKQDARLAAMLRGAAPALDSGPGGDVAVPLLAVGRSA